MSKNHGVSFYTELLTGVAVTSLTIFLLAHIPLADAITVLFIPLPVFYYFSKLGRVSGALILALGLLTVLAGMAIAGTDAAFPMIVLLAVLGFTMSEVVRFSYRIEKIIIISTALFLLCGFLFLLLEGFKEDLSIWDTMKIFTTKYIQANIDYYSQLDPSSEQLAALKENTGRIVDIFLMLFPSLSLLSTSILVLINLLAARPIFQKAALPFPDFGDLTRWRVPEKIVWIVIMAGFMVMIPAGSLKTIGLNVLLIMALVYLLNGLAVTAFFQDRLNVPRFFRYLFYFALFAVPYAMMGVIVVGLIDVWIDFRKPVKEQDTSPPEE